ncbi:hypothetical protein [Stenotrophomonas nitritireducens]
MPFHASQPANTSSASVATGAMVRSGTLRSSRGSEGIVGGPAVDFMAWAT